MERRLGRGLGSLLGTTGKQEELKETEIVPAGTPEAAADRPTLLPVEQLGVNPQQPRTVFKAEHLEELCDSIRRHGILQPIVVRPVEGRYEIISGERRFRAAQMAGLKEVPIILRETTDQEMLELALVENVQRQDLDALEKARGFRDMMDRLDLTQDQVATKVGLKRSTVANHLRLLDLPDPVQEGVVQGLITMGHARALLGLSTPGEILKAFQRVVREELSVRATEALVRDAGSSKEAPQTPATAEKPQVAPWARDFENRLQEGLQVRSQVLDSSDGKYRGRVVLHYHDRAELERLMESLAPKDRLT